MKLEFKSVEGQKTNFSFKIPKVPLRQTHSSSDFRLSPNTLVEEFKEREQAEGRIIPDRNISPTHSTNKLCDIMSDINEED